MIELLRKASTILISTLFRLGGWGLMFAGLVHAANTPRPNLIFILTDDQRYDTLGVTGDGFIRTPHLDQLAAEVLVQGKRAAVVRRRQAVEAIWADETTAPWQR